MKKILLGLLVMGFLSVGLFSMVNAEDDFSVSISSKVWSKYLGATGSIVHNKPVLQTDIFVSLPKGFYFDIWHSMGLDDKKLSSNFGDEMDLTLGWTGSIGKKFYLDVGIAYYDCYPLLRGKNYDAFAPYVEVGKSIELGRFLGTHTLVPFGRLELNLPTGDVDSGTYSYAGLKHVWKISEKLSVKQKADFLYDSGSFGATSGLIGRYESGLSWQIFKKMSVEPINIKTRTPITSIPGHKTEVVIGTGITLYF